ncbi:MAG: DUF4080 domain-containing protein [Planctomycetes bacterium]|nr:DUF4080 domain-containing protein [Planctomycetota bacterium]
MAGPSILLATLNARYSHASMGLRYLLANLGDLSDQAALREFTINDPLPVVAERLLAGSPRIIAFGVYIWNLRETTRVVRIIKAVDPRVRIVIGGPEVSHEYEHEPLVALADVLITGEADLVFPGVCRDLLAGQAVPHVVVSPKPDLATLALPYDHYTDEDLAHRVIYVEASRGCPYTCEFCLSSIENGVRAFPLDHFLTAMDRLIQRGCRTFKFVDRTFNLNPRTATAILEFFLARLRPSLFLHFEMVPDRLPDAVKALIARFPAGAIQFEIGIQSFTPAVGELISRRMDRAKTVENLEWLRRNTGVHVHADLIIGLPGETMATLAESFDALWWLQPGEIQVGILKLLKGTPLARHRDAFAMVYNPDPPYDLLQSLAFDFPTMQRLKRFARYFELYANSGRFRAGLDLLIARAGSSPFAALLAFSDWLWDTLAQEHGISLKRLYELIAVFLITRLGCSDAEVSTTLAEDFLSAHGNPQGVLKGLPEFLRAEVEVRQRSQRSSPPSLAAPAAR